MRERNRNESNSFWVELAFASVALSLGTTFVLLSVNYEVLFFASLCALLLLWQRQTVQETTKLGGRAALELVEWRDVDSALVYVFLVRLRKQKQKTNS